MKCAILQSGYLSWLGFFDLIDQSDIFVFLDDVQWTKRDWRNRNRIRTPQGWSWLTVPVNLKKSSRACRICDVELSESQKWQEKHLNLLKSSYRRAPFFIEIFALFEEILNSDFTLIVDLNYALIFKIVEYLELKNTRFEFAQKMSIPEKFKKSAKLLYILEQFKNVTAYISGPLAKDYMNLDVFTERGFEVLWHEYEHPFYNQNMWKTNVFISHLSILDLLFNYGKESLGILTKKRVIAKSKDVIIESPKTKK